MLAHGSDAPPWEFLCATIMQHSAMSKSTPVLLIVLIALVIQAFAPALFAAAPVDDPIICLLGGTPPVAFSMAPSRVSIARDTRGLIWTVNDKPVTITGMNYNVDYTRLPEAAKRNLHRRDFAIMQGMGVNAIVGWGIYDHVTLEVAQEFGIGVIMPFDLDPQAPFDNRDYREQVKSDFIAYVKQYKDEPAVWAWNPGGDELLYRMDTEAHRTIDKIQIAADFMVELAALAASLDPQHVSVIKEPRDFYVPELDNAIKSLRARTPQPDPRTFMVFGVNVYGHPDDVSAAIRAAKRNAEERMGIAFLVTEYAPFELPREDRARNYGEIWDAVSAYSPNGGMVYVFGPDQPNPGFANPYDSLHLLPNEFSLVDNAGIAVDDTLCALAQKYRQAR